MARDGNHPEGVLDHNSPWLWTGKLGSSPNTETGELGPAEGSPIALRPVAHRAGWVRTTGGIMALLAKIGFERYFLRKI